LLLQDSNTRASKGIVVCALPPPLDAIEAGKEHEELVGKLLVRFVLEEEHQRGVSTVGEGWK
jgi:hypothetical protein